jgi:hypothetical protein
VELRARSRGRRHRSGGARHADTSDKSRGPRLQAAGTSRVNFEAHGSTHDRTPPVHRRDDHGAEARDARVERGLVVMGLGDHLMEAKNQKGFVLRGF